MSRSNPMLVVAALYIMIVAGSLAWAQGTDRDSCVDACQQVKGQCISTCDTHDNPVQCDEDCQEAGEDCIRQCG